MSANPKPQRIRDPLHNIVKFDNDQFEHTLWQVIQTPPFQRLRRIRQLGFSEFVFPGATHTRFAHSIGVFHTARQLMGIVKEHLRSGKRQVGEHEEKVAMAAALVHDIGHGMFSHSFEDIGRELGIPLARHESVTGEILRSPEMMEVFKPLGDSFAEEVARVIERKGPNSVYGAVVSSQFDADRLDYMQRDRIMAGVQHTGIDFAWLIDNLEIGMVPQGADEEQAGEIETFVLGPKAIHAAETFVLALFQLYPTIYFHKTTRAAEKVFASLMLRIVGLARDGHAVKSGLPENHPIVDFAKNSDCLERVLALDDTVFWGALPMLACAEDEAVKRLACRLRDRKLPKCVDILTRLQTEFAPASASTIFQSEEFKARLSRTSATIEERLRAWSNENSSSEPRILIDKGERDPYKPYQESKGPLNQMRIRNASGEILDIADFSPVVRNLEKFEFFRAYVDALDNGAKDKIEQTVKKALKEGDHG